MAASSRSSSEPSAHPLGIRALHQCAMHAVGLVEDRMQDHSRCGGTHSTPSNLYPSTSSRSSSYKPSNRTCCSRKAWSTRARGMGRVPKAPRSRVKACPRCDEPSCAKAHWEYLLYPRTRAFQGCQTLRIPPRSVGPGPLTAATAPAPQCVNRFGRADWTRENRGPLVLSDPGPCHSSRNDRADQDQCRPCFGGISGASCDDRQTSSTNGQEVERIPGISVGVIHRCRAVVAIGWVSRDRSVTVASRPPFCFEIGSKCGRCGWVSRV